MGLDRSWWRRRGLRAGVFLVGVAPALGLLLDGLTAQLGANPIETLTHTTGDWALRFLLASLAVTPLRKLFGWSFLAPHRRTLGLFAFFYASMHLLTYVALDMFFHWAAIVEDVVERPYITAGFAGFLCLVPLAITSTRAWMRRLGRRWVALHRLVYVAGVAVVIHYLWLTKADDLAPMTYGALLAVLLGARLWLAFGRPRTAAARSLV